MNGVTLLPAVDLLSMLRQKQISPLELAEEYIAQIKRWNPGLCALVDLMLSAYGYRLGRYRTRGHRTGRSTGCR